jgi:hypothetical protein
MGEIDLKSIKVGDIFITDTDAKSVLNLNQYGRVVEITDTSFFVDWGGELNFTSEYPFKLPEEGNELDRWKANWATMFKYNTLVQDEKEILAFLLKLD